MGAPPVGLQYGKLPVTGKAWIPRVKNNMFVRDSPSGWRQPRKKLNLNTPSVHDGAAAVAAKRVADQQKNKRQEQEQRRKLGWGVSAPNGADKARGGGKGGAVQPPQKENRRPQEAKGPNVVTRGHVAKATAAFEAKVAKATKGHAPSAECAAPPEEHLKC